MEKTKNTLTTAIKDFFKQTLAKSENAQLDKTDTNHFLIHFFNEKTSKEVFFFYELETEKKEWLQDHLQRLTILIYELTKVEKMLITDLRTKRTFWLENEKVLNVSKKNIMMGRISKLKKSDLQLNDERIPKNINDWEHSKELYRLKEWLAIQVKKYYLKKNKTIKNAYANVVFNSIDGVEWTLILTKKDANLEVLAAKVVTKNNKVFNLFDFFNE